MSYVRRLISMTAAMLCFFIVVIWLPSDHTRLLAGEVLWSDVAAFILILVAASFTASALLDWDDRRKRRKSQRD